MVKSNTVVSSPGSSSLQIYTNYVTYDGLKLNEKEYGEI